MSSTSPGSTGTTLSGKRKRRHSLPLSKRKKKQIKYGGESKLKSHQTKLEFHFFLTSTSQNNSHTHSVTDNGHISSEQLNIDISKDNSSTPDITSNIATHLEHDKHVKQVYSNDIIIQTPTGTTGTTRSTSISTNRKIYSNKCPPYKWVKGTRFTVDAFNYGTIDGCHGYFLSHFHSDHYTGLSRQFKHNIYCSTVTANLLCQQLKIDSQIVHPLTLDQTHVIDNVEVTLIEANHCPGATMFLFRPLMGYSTTVLHTGDFRFSQSMKQYFRHLSISTIYLDTTYCNSKYNFPCQDDTISFIVDKAICTLIQRPDTLIVCGTYTVGKEKIFLALSQAIGSGVYMSKEKYQIIKCLESDELTSIVNTQYPAQSNIHVISINKMTMEDLMIYLSNFNTHFSHLLAFKPTGWTFSNKRGGLGNIRPFVRGPITIYGVPYSEHSSFSELRDFIKLLKPTEVISTVGGAKTHKMAESQCYKWLIECDSGCHGNNSKNLVQSTLDCYFNKK